MPAYPERVDWRERGAVTPVQDQGSCNLCWAFATTAAMEGAFFAAHGELKKLSEQLMGDCCHGDPCGGRDPGCMHGGCIHCALEWLQSNYQVLETEYPFIGNASSSCRMADFPPQASALAVTILDENSLTQMLHGLNVVPMAVGVDSSTDDFMFYKSGIFNDPKCGTDIDHAVLAVGYALASPMTGQPAYWLIKNSFGTSWGEEGYIRIMMTKDGDPGICGVQNDCQYATAK